MPGGAEHSEGARDRSSRRPVKISVIVPALDEAAAIGAALEALAPLRAAGHQLIVVDGGSRDATVALARQCADRVIVAPCGRALQMNAGAAEADGEVLLFLHADTRLPEGAAQIIEAGLDRSGLAWGRFDVRIEGRSALLGVIAALMNLRSRLTGIATGDQAIFVRRDAFAAVGGYPPVDLMEDVALSRALKRVCAPLCLRARVATSGRRWEANGVLRTVALMWWLRLRYALGADPALLARRYAGSGGRQGARVVVFARAPEPGRAKTRLIPALGAEGAAALHRAMVERTLAAAAASGVGAVELWCAPDAGHPFFAECARRHGVALAAQCEGDLGARMHHAFRTRLRCCERVLLIGTDAVGLDAQYLREADEALRSDADAAIGPAEDGGYVLIGLRRVEARVFDGIEWGGAQVFRATQERMIALGWRTRVLATLADIDRPEDLARLDPALLAEAGMPGDAHG